MTKNAQVLFLTEIFRGLFVTLMFFYYSLGGRQIAFQFAYANKGQPASGSSSKRK